MVEVDPPLFCKGNACPVASPAKGAHVQVVVVGEVTGSRAASHPAETDAAAKRMDVIMVRIICQSLGEGVSRRPSEDEEANGTYSSAELQLTVYPTPVVHGRQLRHAIKDESQAKPQDAANSVSHGNGLAVPYTHCRTDKTSSVRTAGGRHGKTLITTARKVMQGCRKRKQ